ncbi:hypothetical protein [Microbacterium sp. SLBN-146]|uniref:hypothetical protein n=1 Tax=Microbacterium sp. SLBN-146 TaxID=2768457 RepID=UPI0011524923|nr:hypothetical protein [Microbacterium sp. SLBN-146]TQJ30999.1 hypothetical protein FBY39_1458 [Microbacterium sp. SLBN-146]
MTSIQAAGSRGESEGAEGDAPTRRRRGIRFWIIRYLPAEISGTAAMVVAGLAASVWTENDALVAVAALVGEIVGFYVVLAATVAIEQARLGQRRVLARTSMLLVAEFGGAELIDTLLVRPLALLAGVSLLKDPVVGLLAGKIVADVIFYAVAAGAFTVTERTGLRRRGTDRRVAS